MRAALLAALALAALLPGCATPGAGPISCPGHGYATVSQEGRPPGADPRQPADVPYVVSGLEPRFAPTLAANTTVATPQEDGHGAPVAAERTEFNSTLPGQRLERLRFAPADLARGIEVRWRITDAVPAGCDGGAGGLTHTVGGAVQEGRMLTPGHGAHVWYAGFWENGTLFETNIEALDHSHWPRAGWYESSPYDPLPVYVYDRNRSEEPTHWKPPTQAARTGTPVDGPLSLPLGAATQEGGLGYSSTIRGFNEGLKGLSTTGQRVVWMAAKDAYPTGTANNPLAGANLVFLVRLADIVDQPCPTPPATGTVPCPESP